MKKTISGVGEAFNIRPCSPGGPATRELLMRLAVLSPSQLTAWAKSAEGQCGVIMSWVGAFARPATLEHALNGVEPIEIRIRAENLWTTP